MPVVFGFLAVVGLLGLFAPRLPLVMQRSLAVVPFIQIDPLVRMDAESSTGWRLQMWREVLPEVPQYLLIGKGYSFSGTEQAALRSTLAATELVGNYHNGPLSVIIPFGLLGAISFVWLMVAGIRVLRQNYQFGDPAYHHLNTFLFAYFVIKVLMFFLVFGSFHSDLAMFLGVLALSISLNGGAAKPAVVPRPKLVFNRFKLHPSVRGPVGA
jgi:O-antigen ligase